MVWSKREYFWNLWNWRSPLDERVKAGIPLSLKIWFSYWMKRLLGLNECAASFTVTFTFLWAAAFSSSAINFLLVLSASLSYPCITKISLGLWLFIKVSRQTANFILSLTLLGMCSKKRAVPSWFKEPVGVTMKSKSKLKLLVFCNSERRVEKIFEVWSKAKRELPLASRE